MKTIKTYFASEEITYDGAPLESLWAYRRFHIEGDSMVVFQGRCDIPFDRMVDLEDVQAHSKIYSEKMLHFIAEHFEIDLEKAVWRQRLLTVLVKEELEQSLKKPIRRIGDDLFDGEAKLTISVATLTPVSSKIHFGINIESRHTPVLTRGLNDYDIAVERFGQNILKRYADEIHSIEVARCKVRATR